jgi:hypothetical protein
MGWREATYGPVEAENRHSFAFEARLGYDGGRTNLLLVAGSHPYFQLTASFIGLVT